MEVLDHPAAKEEDEMSHRKLSRMITAGTLAALLMLPGIARADTGAGEPSGVWQWMVSLLEEGVSALWAAGEAPNAGPGFDPNGGQTTSQVDAGPGFDPNGG
jgi:hypothetical protein